MTSENASARRETVADIVREMRECRANHPGGGCFDCKSFDCQDVRKFAHRIEAAHKREVGKVCEYALPNGGCAAENEQRKKVQRLRNENARMRKAIVNAMRVVEILK